MKDEELKELIWGSDHVFKMISDYGLQLIINTVRDHDKQLLIDTILDVPTHIDDFGQRSIVAYRNDVIEAVELLKTEAYESEIIEPEIIAGNPKTRTVKGAGE